ncbi:MAG: hypothetical protein LUE29_11925 [Lachnospiraceae bacterium]|nr:hypothetical protein [Lachnospiraceae bacterium]
MADEKNMAEEREGKEVTESPEKVSSPISKTEGGEVTADSAAEAEAAAKKAAEDMYEEVEDRFFLEYFDANRVLASAERLDSVYLRFIETGERHSESERGVYISELAEATGFPIKRISSMMTRLQDKGYIVWKTNTEKDRTYVELTGKAKEALATDMDRNWKLYKTIRENVSLNDLTVTAKTLHRISELISGDD